MEFFIGVADPLSPNAEPWDTPTSSLIFDSKTVEEIRRGALQNTTALESAIGLAELVHDQLQRYGTDSSQLLNDAEIGSSIVALRATLRRLSVPLELPFRNFSTFRSYWIRSGAAGSWQARREILESIFEPLHARLIELDERRLEGLIDPVSPHKVVGWPAVDEEIAELRRRFASASTPQDYRALGTNCVGVLEALGAVVFDSDKHLKPGEVTPPRDKTNIRIGRYIECALAGPANADLRGLAVKTAALAHHVKHSPHSNRRDAGIAADAVIMLANMLRRCSE